MAFNSYLFLFAFLPLVWAGYRLALRAFGVSASIILLGLASYAFYLANEAAHPWLLAASILANFLVGRLLSATTGRERPFVLGLAVAANLGVLGYFKYADFILAQFVSSGAAPPVALGEALPVGLSFYSFTQIAFLVDAYRGDVVERRLGAYALFVSYFPHLVAGPILHHREMLPQFRHPQRDRLAEDVFAGLAMLSIGLAKKVLLADTLGDTASGIFQAAATPAGAPSLFVAWIGAIAYALQIYFDFSGYSDMAIGVSRLLGIDLPINFNSPYKSATILQFWRRWHITLSRFLRDYVYIPLGGSRRGALRHHLNIAVTMVLAGLWHGAGWTFLLWGTMHGVAQSIALGWQALRNRIGLAPCPGPLGWFATMIFVLFAWVPFRASSIAATASIWKAMLGQSGFALPDLRSLRGIAPALGLQAVDFGTSDLAVMLVASVIALACPNSQELLARFAVGIDSAGYDARGRPHRWHIGLNWRSCLWLGLVLGLALRLVGRSGAFIYFRF
jgi:alginate O-acetyltransferase complex protein AlgI